MIKSIKKAACLAVTLSFVLPVTGGMAFEQKFSQPSKKYRSKHKANQIKNTTQHHGGQQKAKKHNNQHYAKSQSQKSKGHWRSKGRGYAFWHPGSVSTLKSIGDRSTGEKLKDAFEYAKEMQHHYNFP